MSAEAPGTLVEALTPTYVGQGAYRVRYAFAPADLGGDAERTRWFHVGFEDSAGCAIDKIAPIGRDLDGDPENRAFSVRTAP